MKILILLWQIRDLFTSNFTWRGLLLLALFVLMALIAVGLGAFVSYKAFQPKGKNKNADDV